jgi:enamine deaminase RidA (YjgF/YER057c/UK114 family)
VTVERRNVPSLLPPPDYAHVAVGTGRIVFTAGGVPIDSHGDLVGPGDYEEQTRRVLANLIEALDVGGALPQDVVKTTVYVVTAGARAPLPAVWEVVRASPLAGTPSTLLGVSALGYDGQLVEIEAVAVID